MRASLHRRRANLSLPPQHKRFPRGLVLCIVIASITVAVAAARARVTEPSAPALAGVALNSVGTTETADLDEATGGDAASQQTRALVDERLHLHLKKLQALR